MLLPQAKTILYEIVSFNFESVTSNSIALNKYKHFRCGYTCWGQLFWRKSRK